MRLAWLTDIHLNFIDMGARIQFYEKVKATQCEAVLISGDIAEACPVEKSIKRNESAYQ